MYQRTDSNSPALELLSGYQFRALGGLALKRERVRVWLETFGMKGTVLLASEGVNFSLCGSGTQLDEWLVWLRERLDCDRPIINRQSVPASPFVRLKVRIRPEIVTFAGAESNRAGDPLEPGVSVAPGDWNALLDQPEMQVVDTRNAYEVRLGTFEHAQDPATESFTDFQHWARSSLDRNRPVAMFCTGGVRCEKASDWLKREGFSEVYQLEGGILSYLDQMDAAESKWRGECFVFDDRVAVNAELEPTGRAICLVCRMPTDVDRDLCSVCAEQLAHDPSSGRAEKVRQLRLVQLRAQLEPDPIAETG